MTQEMPKEALVKTLEKLLEPVSGKSVYLTANDLLAVWDFFDIDHDGVLLAEEYELFVRILGEILKTVFPNYGRTLLPDLITAAINPGLPYQIGIDEISHLLNEEERFLLVFRKLSNIQSSFDFMKDHSGVIENEEFEGLVKDLLDSAKKNYDTKELDEFKDILLKQWDENSDGKISKSELKLLLLHSRSMFIIGCHLAAL
ncbi:Calbindin [Echinococcus granulosus]|uniref:Calbindin n=1 Tax=Echinococcus granulosus TaxID=6210 RepID=W6UPY2_ECHGR|nr:Calbindin [Echinococcus granulosus]EUB60357.1 Calbindin [Echinococcus granulosus]